MTIAQTDDPETVPVPEGHVRLTVDGVTVDAPKGELIIRTAERIGVEVPRFCDHPLLDPAAACRQCLVEVEMGGRPMPKPQPACAVTVADGMVVKTQASSAVADKAQQGVMELLLINHPLDCPICDKGGECPLQNQALKHGRAESRFVDTKRTFAKPVPITAQVLLDRERCVLCQRCTRFADEIAGDVFIDLLERGAVQQIGTHETADLDETDAVIGQPHGSYFSGNIIQICPVGALTSAAYRFRSRPFDLVSTPSMCEHCASGCAQRSDWRRGHVTRRLAGNDPAVNEEWNCDKGRFAFRYATAEDRLRKPLVRGADNELHEASWTDALRAAAAGLAKARGERGVAVLPGGRLTVEDAYAYAKFARLALHTNDVDFRARVHSAEELDFLTDSVVGRTPEHGGVSYADIESAPAVLSVAFEPEEESPIVFLRLRKAARKRGLRYFHLGQWTTPAVDKAFGALVPVVPGDEARGLRELDEKVRDALGRPGALILVGERAAGVAGLPTAVRALSSWTGARVAWIPRRAGERGALEAGATPTLLPGGRPVTDAAARAEVERAWGVAPGGLPGTPGRDTGEILAAAADSRLSALVVGGVDPFDLPDPELALTALTTVDFVVSLELRPSEVTRRADVVLPVAPVQEKTGAYLDWEGRRREFESTLSGTGALPDCRVLDTLAVEMDVDLFTQTSGAAAGDLARLGRHSCTNEPVPVSAGEAARPGVGEAVLATWRTLLDNGSLQEGEPHLAATAKPVVARLSVATATGLGVQFGEPLTVSTARGSIVLPAVQADLPDGVVWLPENSGRSAVRRVLGVGHGAVVSVSAGGEH
ncbi:MAG TPA: NADH-quinone oxidoreductase subunit G [Pseudonocardiaceae bacterium]|nr:NADH-quinone oxidoreductase subunit G [Pseudonocardiaceae bacterium]